MNSHGIHVIDLMKPIMMKKEKSNSTKNPKINRSTVDKKATKARKLKRAKKVKRQKTS